MENRNRGNRSGPRNRSGNSRSSGNRGGDGGFGGGNRSGGNRGGGGNRFGGGNRSGGNRGGGGNRFGGGGDRKDNFNRGPREMHKAVCSECKKECEVPFKPTTGKPIYCRDCFSKHKNY